MDVQIKSSIFKRSDLISVLALLHYLKNACDSNEIYKGAAMRIFSHFRVKPAAVVPSYEMSTVENNNILREESLDMDCLFLN